MRPGTMTALLAFVRLSTATELRADVRRIFGPHSLGSSNTNGVVLLPMVGVLLFSDTGTDRVSYYALNLTSGAARAISVLGHSFGGMALDERGTGLYAADHTTAQIVHVAGGDLATGRGLSLTPLTERLPPPLPNGVLVRPDGVLYFTAGALYSRRRNGTVRVEAPYARSYANGLALAPATAVQSTTLYVAVTFPSPAGIDAYAVADDGALTALPDGAIRDSAAFAPFADELAYVPYVPQTTTQGGYLFAATGSDSLAWFDTKSRAVGRLPVAPGAKTVSVAATSAGATLLLYVTTGGSVGGGAVYSVRLRETHGVAAVAPSISANAAAWPRSAHTAIAASTALPRHAAIATAGVVAGGLLIVSRLFARVVGRNSRLPFSVAPCATSPNWAGRRAIAML